MMMNMRKLILSVLMAFMTFAATAQQEADSTAAPARDVIVKTNGNMFHCSILEVNDSLVNYTLPDMDTTGQVNKVSRGEVYAIAYGNGLATVITPELMGKEANIYKKEKCCENLSAFKKNLGSGAINVGVGFVDQYSPLKDTKSFEDNKTMPKIFVGYTFKINSFLKGGIHIGLGGNELSKSGTSEYDQVMVSADIEETFINVGLFCRYDILKGAFKPYVKAGVDFMGINMVTTSEAVSLNGSGSSLKTVVHQSGIKPYMILRAGLDVYFSDLFGIYGDVGTGLSLVQVGILINLE
jgi:hypothetical protein